MSSSSSSSSSVIRSISNLGFPFKTPDPFLFCVYHKDNYPVGNKDNMNAPRRGNGADFDWSLEYRMYHGELVPGFPQHPHRGFETITLVQEGTCDHTDSVGQSGRYGGNGRAADLQWMTAGRGCVHGENFPLIHTTKPNTLRLFQIWLNLPKKSKFCPPTFKMFWAENMKFIQGKNGAECEVAAGAIGSVRSESAPPDSWGNDINNDVGVFYITLPPNGGEFTLPPSNIKDKTINRYAYIVEGNKDKNSEIYVEDRMIDGGRATLDLDSQKSVTFINKHKSIPADVLVLQGRPIGEPVSQRGPFVMNSEKEIMEAYRDYQNTQFGGWPWDEDAVVFPRTTERFAENVVDGKKIRSFPPSSSTSSPNNQAPKTEL